jgi:type I restriction enzyme S subunit
MKHRLGDICTITKGETGIMKAIPGAYTMVALGEANKTHNEFQFDTKAVIIPLVSSTGHGHASMKRVKYQEGKFALGNILCAVIPKDENVVLAKYLHIYLHWNKEELLVSQMKGMANVSLPMNKIADVLVTVPSIAKQKAIIDLEVQLVEKEMAVEKLLSDQLTKLTNLNQAILQEAVQGKLVKQDPKDEPASELLKRIKAEKAKSGKKEKPLPPIKPEEIPFEIPENWVWCRLGEVCSKITDGFHNTPPKVADGFPYIAATQVKSDKIDWDSCHYVSENFHRELYVKTTPKKGEILVVNIGAGCGTPAIIDVDFEFSFKNTAILKFDQNEIHNKFIFYYFLLKRDEFYKDLTKGGLQPFLSLKILNDIVFPLAPLSEQKRIVAEIEKQLAKTKQLKEHIISNQQATEQLLKALLHQAFEVEAM